MIESNLKVTSNCVLFLYVNNSYEDFGSRIQSALNIIMLLIFIVWPFFLAFFLYWKKSELEKPEFKRKFFSMYIGIKTKSMKSLLHTSVFCFRRFLLVIAIVVCGRNVI